MLSQDWPDKPRVRPDDVASLDYWILITQGMSADKASLQGLAARRNKEQGAGNATAQTAKSEEIQTRIFILLYSFIRVLLFDLGKSKLWVLDSNLLSFPSIFGSSTPYFTFSVPVLFHAWMRVLLLHVRERVFKHTWECFPFSARRPPGPQTYRPTRLPVFTTNKSRLVPGSFLPLLHVHVTSLVNLTLRHSSSSPLPLLTAGKRV